LDRRVTERRVQTVEAEAIQVERRRFTDRRALVERRAPKSRRSWIDRRGSGIRFTDPDPA
jgi:hypothetical protein